MLYGPTGDVAVAPEWQDLATKLVNGDGLGWPGDPRLDLRISILTNRKTRKQGRRLEVWRTNEDGSETIVSHWLPSEQARVCYDLARMRVEAPGHDPVLDRIDKANAEIEAKASQEFQDTYGQMLDHTARLFHDRSNPRNTFYLNGSPDRGARA